MQDYILELEGIIKKFQQGHKILETQGSLDLETLKITQGSLSESHNQLGLVF